jgi:hypothetical protein
VADAFTPPTVPPDALGQSRGLLALFCGCTRRSLTLSSYAWCLVRIGWWACGPSCAQGVFMISGRLSPSIWCADF